MTEAKCQSRVEERAHGRLGDLCSLLDGVAIDEGYEDTEAALSEYGLWFDYVVDGNYFRFTLSTGGPHEEIRFFADDNGDCLPGNTIEFWLLDWFDGAKYKLVTHDKVTARRWLTWFKNNHRRFMGSDDAKSFWTLEQFKNEAVRQAMEG